MTQKDALDMLKLGHNVYLTGSAGSGKTYLLNQYIQYLQKHDVPVAITASTGIAASHMNGSTIHSWSGLGVRKTLSPYDLEAMEEKKYLWDRFKKTKVLIIDEVSMLHHYRLDLVDKIARFFKRIDAPFGGLQVILCGDFFQLPPVTRRGEDDALFAYHSAAWKTLGLKVCYLTESHRQEDAAFLSVLNAIRKNDISKEILSHLESRFNKPPSISLRPTKLYTHNEDVDAINQAELEKIDGETHTYRMTSEGWDTLTAVLKSTCLASEVLKLKVGTQVMFVKNNTEGGYVNGTLGTVVQCKREYPVIRTARGELINAEPVEWMLQDDGKVKAKIKQVPLRLAWAITVHKSQGMTLDVAEIDLSKSFEKGMGYVALSRVKSLEGLTLLGLNDNALQVDEEILEFDRTLQEASEKIRLALEKFDSEEKITQQETFLAHITPLAKDKKKKKGKKGDTQLETKKLILEKIGLKEMSEKRNIKPETIISHIETLCANGELQKDDIEYLRESSINYDRLEEIHNAFEKIFKKTGSYQLIPVKSILPGDFSFEEIRLARLFINP
jgi:ATP-dependent exoDNAse (exonuclease V) alpha subunit